MDWRDAEATFDDPLLGRASLPATFEASVGRHGSRDAQRYKGGVYDRALVDGGVIPAAPHGTFAALSYAEMGDLVRTLAAGFDALGVEAGDRIGLFSHTRMEWALCDFALLARGGVVSTVYPTSSDRQLRSLLDDAGASGVVVENATRLEQVARVEDDLDLSFVVVVDRLTEAPTLDARVVTLDELHALGTEVFDADQYGEWVDDCDPDDLASLIYTSGTTGTPKGVRLTHWNFKSNVDAAYRRFGPRPDRDGPAIEPGTVTLSYLPLSHVFERLAGHFLMLSAGATVAYAESPETLREDFRLVRPTIGTSVPRVYEKLYDAIRTQASSSAVRQRLFEWAVEVGRSYHVHDEPGAALRLQHRIAERLVFSKVRAALGGRVDFFISGGGSLSPELCALYHGMGLPILEGYGLTETSPVVSVNPFEAPHVGTIGPPLAGVDVRVDESVGPVTDGHHPVGELLVSGPNVADGYWNLPDATADALEQDAAGKTWFRTGDVVELRPDDYIVFRERAKQLLSLSTGKLVPPGPIEDAFASSPFVEQVMVVGDGRKFVGALVVPNVDAVRAWGEREGYDLPESRRGLCTDERVLARLRREVDRVNDQFEPHERIKQFRLVPEEFSEANDLLTPTMKKKRRNILTQYADEVDLLYDE